MPSEQRQSKARQTGCVMTQMMITVRRMIIVWIKVLRIQERAAAARYAETRTFRAWWALLKARWARWRVERKYPWTKEEDGESI